MLHMVVIMQVVVKSAKLTTSILTANSHNDTFRKHNCQAIHSSKTPNQRTPDMPAIIKLLTAKGLQNAPYSATSLADAAQHEPYAGVYTVTNTYDSIKVLKLDAHLDRMENSARIAGIPLRLDRPALRAALRSMILASGFGDVRFRVTCPQNAPEQLILSIEPYTPPSEDIIQTGIRVITVPNSARHDAAAKTTDWLHDREQIEKNLPPGVYTALLMDAEGFLLEGVSSNFYAVLNDRIHTAGEGVLAGIAQQIVFEVAPAILPLHMQAVHLRDIPRLSEAFITSSSRGIMPVVQIDAHLLGDGHPGPRTQRLRAAYLAWANAHLEAL
jgi:branched-chain amino acid aminotransferase